MISGATYREGVAYSPDGAMYVTLAGGTASATLYRAGNGTNAAPSYSFTNHTQTGMYLLSASPATLGFSAGSTIIATGNANFDGISLGGSQDAWLIRDAANVLAQRNGTTAQTLRVYKTYTDGSNNSRWEIDHATTAGTVYVGQRTIGTGTVQVPVGIGAGSKTLTESVATGFVTISVASSEVTAGLIEYAVVAADATNTQAKSGQVFFSAAANSTGTVTAAALSDVNTLNPCTSGTLTNTMTQTTAANSITFLANAASSLTQTTLVVRYRVTLYSGTATVTAQ
jgi:hypothetical protein